MRWFRSNNKLYSDFFCEYETLFRFAKPAFINPVLLEKQSIPLDRLLEEEAVGMAFPVDATYFDQFPLIFDEGLSDIAGRQNPRLKVSQDKLKELTKARYGDHDLEAKTFPHLHPWGFGGWYYGCGIPYHAHCKMRLFDVRGWFASDQFYPYFRYDCMTKMRLRMSNAGRVVKVGNLQESLDAGKVKSQDPYSIYGSQVPRVIPGSKQYWKSFGLDLVAFVQQQGLLDYFVTLTAFDGWPHVQTALARGWGAIPNEGEYQDLARKIEDRQPVGSHPEYSVIAAEKHFLWIMYILRSENGLWALWKIMFGKRSIRKEERFIGICYFG